MNVQAVLKELADYGVAVTGNRETLRVTGPVVFLNRYMRDWLLAHKAEIAAILAGDWTGAALALLIRLGTSVADDALHDLAEQFDERVGIAEYDGNVPRQEAERIAYQQIAAQAERVEAEARKICMQDRKPEVNYDSRKSNHERTGREWQAFVMS